MNERPSLDPEAKVESHMHITSIPLNVTLQKEKKKIRDEGAVINFWVTI